VQSNKKQYDCPSHSGKQRAIREEVCSANHWVHSFTPHADFMRAEKLRILRAPWAFADTRLGKEQPRLTNPATPVYLVA
jgi:hypothetical protein